MNPRECQAALIREAQQAEQAAAKAREEGRQALADAFEQKAAKCYNLSNFVRDLSLELGDW